MKANAGMSWREFKNTLKASKVHNTRTQSQQQAGRGSKKKRLFELL